MSRVLAVYVRDLLQEVDGPDRKHTEVDAAHALAKSELKIS